MFEAQRPWFMAIGLMKGLCDRGCTLPNDVSIVAYDDSYRNPEAGRRACFNWKLELLTGGIDPHSAAMPSRLG